MRHAGTRGFGGGSFTPFSNRMLPACELLFAATTEHAVSLRFGPSDGASSGDLEAQQRAHRADGEQAAEDDAGGGEGEAVAVHSQPLRNGSGVHTTAPT